MTTTDRRYDDDLYLNTIPMRNTAPGYCDGVVPSSPLSASIPRRCLRVPSNMKRLLQFLLFLPLSVSYILPSVQRRLPVALCAAEKKQHSTATERFNERWNIMFERLKDYKKMHGDCLVPFKYIDDPKLGSWVS